MASKILLNDDDYGDEYAPSGSEDEYTEQEKSLLKKVRQKRRRKDDDEVEEVLRFADSESDDENDLVDNSDFEEDGDDDIPDSKAWGKKRSSYYNTDFVDQDYSTYNEKEEEQARQEEEAARAIQLRLAKELEEADFTLDVFSEVAEVEQVENEPTVDVLKRDLSNLPIRQKEQLFQKDSPEFAGLVQDFQHHLQESESLLNPVIVFATENSLKAPVIEFARLQNNIILTYCTNISFYLLLKAKRIPVKNHPVVKRLVQLKQLLEKLGERYEQVVKPQLESLLEAIQAGVDVIPAFTKQAKPAQKKLKMMRQFDQEEVQSEDESGLSSAEETEIPQSDDQEGSEMEVEEHEEEEDGEGRRAITHQIAKNKGLTPHRKKDVRNPRVKHRNKYKKALVRRKGAVRTVRKEHKRYDGEISGIKATVKKGIKIRS